MDLVSAIKIAQRGFNTWAVKPHNKKWLRRVDGTPIPNDLAVNIAEAFAEAVPGALEIEMAVGGSYVMPDGRQFWIDGQVAHEITRRVCAIRSRASTPAAIDGLAPGGRDGTEG